MPASTDTFVHLTPTQERKLSRAITFTPLAVVPVETTRHFKDIMRQFYDTLVVIYFHSAGCAACRQVAPAFDQVQQLYGDRAAFLAVDIGRTPAIAEATHVKAVPTVLLAFKGREVIRQTGLMTDTQLALVVRAALQQVARG